MTAGIYAITHTASGRTYIGSAVNVSGRWSKHKSALSRGRHGNQRLQNGWNKHGAEAFTFSVVEDVADVADLIALEQRWFDTLDPFYNILRVSGSSLGYKHGAETLQKISAALKGNTRRLGKKHGAEHRAKLSATAKALPPFSAEHRANMSAALMGHTRNLGRTQTPEHIAAVAAGKRAARAKRGAA